MKYIALLCSSITFTAALTLSFAQQVIEPPAPAPALYAAAPAAAGGDNEKDPAYKVYKEGYACILDDRWNDALKKFAEVSAKFPKSEYLDDAAYWSAYAQKRIDEKKGIEAYKKFIKDYPQSSYVSDALADMSDNISVVVTPGTSAVSVTKAPEAYSYSYGPNMRAGQEAMREAQRKLRSIQFRTHYYPLNRTVAGERLAEVAATKEADPKTRLKIQTLEALGESGNDKESFATLKEVALDKSQPEVLRLTAVNALQDFTKFDVMPVLIDIAKSDPSDDVQMSAINSISDLGSDRNKSVEALITLFNGFPKQKSAQIKSTLYAIANVGNDKAVDFLTKVATTNDDYDLRTEAVYYLGSIGNEKSRSALIQILKSK